jgi:hypothetical protein
MKSLKDILAVVIGLIALGIAIWQGIVFLNTPGSQSGTHHAIYAGIAIVVAVICGIVYFAGHVNKEEEIHITQ